MYVFFYVYLFMKITRNFINKGASYQEGHNYSGWNSEQIKILGLNFPLKKGWISSVLGKEISEEEAKKFIELRGKSIKATKKEAQQNKTSKQLFIGGLIEQLKNNNGTNP